MEEIMEFLDSQVYTIFGDWINKNTFGLINNQEETITINLSLIIIHVFVHEFLHYKYPYLSEKKISKKTNKYVDKLTVNEIHKVVNKIMLLMEG